MRFSLWAYLSDILTKARKRYRFTGFVFGRIGIGVIWPAVKGEEVVAKDDQPELPGIIS